MPNQYTGPKPPLERLLEKVKKTDSCWHWLGNVNTKGRGIFFDGNKSTNVPRFVYTHFKGPIPKGLYVCHSCDNPSCVNPEHLWLGTQKDNMRDASIKERLNKKLTQSQREEIAVSTGKLKDIAKQYGVSFQLVSRIRKGKI